jgi:hypothetical protein
MKDWLLGLIVKWILSEVANGGAEKLADKLKSVALPWLDKQRDELFVRLKREAAATSTPIDDAVIKALEVFLDALIPDVLKK